MRFLGFLIVAFGSWLVDSAVQNRPPLTTLRNLVRAPGDLSGQLAASKGTGQAAPVVPQRYIGPAAVTGPAGSANAAEQTSLTARQAKLVEFGRAVQAQGYIVSEHPLFGGVSPVHAPGSRHYLKGGGAVDINKGAGTSIAEQTQLDKLVPLAASYGLRVIWREAGHFNHMHVDVGVAP